MGVPSGGGANLGNAQGRITIDTSGVRTAQQQVQAASRAMSQALGALGIAGGAAAVQQFTRFAVQATAMATAYARQEVAARSLAGSQSQLNDLLRVYSDSMGGAVADAQALADVTRLQAVGFADSAKELAEFAKAARGISIATGQSQEYIIGQLQLAIANQSTLRLDQLGLGVAEVQQRINELRAANRGLTAEMAYQQAILEAATDKFGSLADSAAGQRTEVEKLEIAWQNLQLELGETFEGNVNVIAEGLAWVLDSIRKDIEETNNLIREYEAAARAPFASRTTIGRVTPTRIDTGGPTLDELRQQDAERDRYARALQDMERQAQRDRLDATRQYEEQRTQIIRDYGKTIAREAEDFARQRARAEEDYARNLQRIWRDIAQREARQLADLERTIADARLDAAERAAERQADYDERIAETRAAANARIAEMEGDFSRQRERAQRDHARRLRDAAANLDAVAIREAQRDFRERQRDAQEDFDERVAKERQNEARRLADLEKAHAKQIAADQKALQKRIEQANEAYTRQLEDARAADAQRIEDMAADFALRQEREDEDRAIRLGRMTQDHQDQLTELGRQHALRLAQIHIHAQDERTQLDLEHKEAMVALGVRNDAWIAELERMERERRRVYDEVWGNTGRGHPSAADPYATLPLPGRTVTPPSSSSTSSVTNTRTSSVVMQPGAVQIFPATNDRPHDIAAAVRAAIADFFEDYLQ